MKALVAHPGTQHAPRLAAALAARERLQGFWTGIAFDEHSSWAKLGRSAAALSRLHTRVAVGVPAHLLHTRPGLELAALLRVRLGQPPEHVWHQRNARFQAAIPDQVLRDSDATIGFDTSGWVLAERCAKLGRPFFLDRTIGHPAALQRELVSCRHHYPQWVSDGMIRPPEVSQAEAEEHRLAYRIVVGSTFARTTLLAAGIEPGRIRVNPYGVDWAAYGAAASAAAQEKRPLRFLFAGTVNARKGVPVLLDAWRAAGLRHAELWLAGQIGRAERALIPPLPGLRVLGHVPREGTRALYAATDVLVLPSLFEGFGLVLLEAIAAGLSVITTPHTGGADFLPHPVLGRLVDVGSVESLASALRAAAASPPSRAEVATAAAPLREHFTWAAYGERWTRILDGA